MKNVDREQFDSARSSVFDHLANYEYNWSFVTKTELKVLQNVVNLIPDVPLQLKMLVSKLIDYSI